MKQEFGSPFSATATHATSAVATIAAITDKSHYITDVSGSSDKAGSLLLVKQGTTIIWQVQLGTTAAGGMTFQHSFSTPLKADASALVSVTIDGTAACYSNISGFTI